MTRLLAVLVAVAAAVGAFTLGTHVGAAGVTALLRAQAHRAATLHARYCAVDTSPTTKPTDRHPHDDRRQHRTVPALPRHRQTNHATTAANAGRR